MKLSRRAVALGVMLALNVVITVLLTPLGFETRPPADLTTLGYVAIGTVIVGLVLDVIALVFLMLKRSRRASVLAIAGSIVFLFPNAVDRTGSFFTLPIPHVISVLEYVFMAVLLVTLFLALQVYTESTRPQG